MLEKFAGSREAIRRFENNQWEIGDRIIEECGPTGNNTSHNNSGALIKQLSETLLEEDGLEYSVNILREYRDISHLYPLANRLARASWTIHREIRDPDLLQIIISALPERERITVATAKKLKKQIMDQRNKELEEERRVKEEEAKRKAGESEERERKAREDLVRARNEEKKKEARKKQEGAVEEKDEIKKELKKNRKPPPRMGPKVKPKPKPSTIRAMRFIARIGEISISLSKSIKEVDFKSVEFSEIEINAMLEALLKHLNIGQQTVESLRQLNGGKRSHLMVVGE